MRFDDISGRCGRWTALAVVALSGCASLPDPVVALQQVVSLQSPSRSEAPAPAATPLQAPAPAPAPARPPVEPKAVVAVPPPAAEVPVNPQIQRAYDEALRLQAAGRTEDAERALRKLAASNPELGGPHANLGLILRLAGKPVEAVAELERAVQARPRQPVYFNQLGIAHRHAGQFEKAREAYERALELDAGYADAVLNLGILNDLYLRNAPRALELYERHQVLTAGKDAAVGKWVAELRNRKPEQRLLVKKEQP